MKKSEVQQIVQANIEGIQKKLGLSSWNILVDYGPAMLDGDDTHYSGMCNTDPSLYESALVTLDHKQFETAAEVLHTLEHELCHAIGSNFDVCQAVLKRLLSKRDYEAMDVLFHIAHERVVGSIQSILKSAEAQK